MRGNFIFKTEAGGGEGAGMAPSVSARIGEGNRTTTGLSPAWATWGDPV